METKSIGKKQTFLIFFAVLDFAQNMLIWGYGEYRRHYWYNIHTILIAQNWTINKWAKVLYFDWLIGLVIEQ